MLLCTEFYVFIFALNQEVIRQTSSERSIIDVHHMKNYYIIPQNKLGQDIYIRAAEMNRLSNIIKMPSGDNKPVKVPVAKNMLDSHLKGKLGRVSRCMVTIIIADAEVSCNISLAYLNTVAHIK